MTNVIEVNSVLPSSARKKRPRQEHDMHPSIRASWRLIARTCKHSSQNSHCNNGPILDLVLQRARSGLYIPKKLVVLYKETLYDLMFALGRSSRSRIFTCSSSWLIVILHVYLTLLLLFHTPVPSLCALLLLKTCEIVSANLILTISI